MGFSALDTDAGIAQLNGYLADKSYIEGFVASQADVAVFEAVKAVDARKYPHAARWFSHIKSQEQRFSQLAGQKKAVSEYGGSIAAPEAEDDIDLFGSESEDEELERAKAERLAAYNAKKAAKPAVIAKSSVVLDVKPWDDTTDLAEMERQVRAIELDGLLWGASELMPIGYGIKKLRISCVVEDNKVGTDLLEEHITGLEDLVQSMDVFSFNKV